MRGRGSAVALLLGAGSVLGLGPAAIAASGSTVHEAVVSTLAPNGDVLSTRVSQLIQLDSESGEEVSLEVPRAQDLVSYRNLTGFTNPSGENGDFVWRTSDSLDATALAKTTQSLPVRVSLTYYLDGREVDPREIKGDEGDVRIRVELENVSGDPKTLTHEGVTSPVLTSTVNQYVPVEYLVRAEFPSDRWRGVGGPDVHVSPSGVEMSIASASGFIFPPATPTKVTVEFEAASDDILLPRMQVFANAHASQEYIDALQAQFEALRALYGGLGGLGDTLTKIYDGTVELADGVDELIGGVGELDEKTGAPVVELDEDGLPTTVLGTIGFLEQAIRNDVLPGLGERDKTTGEGVVTKDERGNATTLLGGLQSSKDTYDDKLIPAMDELIAGVEAIRVGLSSGSSASPGVVEGLDQISDGLGQLIVGLDMVLPGEDPGAKEAIEGLAAALAGIKAAADAGILLTGDPTGLFATISGIVATPPPAGVGGVTAGLLAALGSRNPDGTPVIELIPGTDDPTIIAALGLMMAGLDDEILPGLDQIVAGLDTIRTTALSNPEFTKSQPSLDGKTPKAYFQECPACFDPTSKVFDPATAHPDFQPALREVFVLFSEGIASSLAKLHSFDASSPGLVDGLQQIAEGLQKMAAALQTFDPDDPGLVEGLNLVRGGLQQVSQGLFATNELGVRTTRGQVGDQGDTVGRWQGALGEAGKDASSTGALGQEADSVTTTYVFELAAQSTGTRDNSVRGALMALTAAGLAVLWRRPRFRT